MLHGKCCFLQEQFPFLHGSSDLHSHAIKSRTFFGAKSHPSGCRIGINLFSVSSFSQPNKKTKVLAKCKYHIANDKFQIGLIKMLEILRSCLSTLCNFVLFIIIIFWV